jgi:predicted GNAT family acetyltransferase
VRSGAGATSTRWDFSSAAQYERHDGHRVGATVTSLPPDDPQTDPLEISDRPGAHRFEAHFGDDLAGFLDYHSQPGLLTLLNTEVTRSFEGRGVGSRLVTAALDHARGHGMDVLPICPFATAYIQRHPEYGDLLRFK